MTELICSSIVTHYHLTVNVFIAHRSLHILPSDFSSLSILSMSSSSRSDAATLGSAMAQTSPKDTPQIAVFFSTELKISPHYYKI